MRLCHPPRQLARRQHQEHMAGVSMQRRDLHRALQRRPFARAYIDVIYKQRRALHAGLIERDLDG